MVTTAAKASKQSIAREARWNFGNPRGTPVSLDEFLAEKNAAGFKPLPLFEIERTRDLAARVVREVQITIRDP